MRVHEADLAPEEGAGLRALEVALRAARVRERPIEEARAVGREQVLPDQLDVRTRLLRREQIRRGSRGSSAAGCSGRPCCGRSGAASAPRRRRRGSARGPASTPSAIRSRRWKSSRMPASDASSVARERRAADVAQRCAERRERLVMQRHGPGAAQPLAQRRVRRLERVVPVAVAVGREARARDHAPLDQRAARARRAPARCVLRRSRRPRSGRTAAPASRSAHRRTRAGTARARAAARTRCRRANRPGGCRARVRRT